MKNVRRLLPIAVILVGVVAAIIIGKWLTGSGDTEAKPAGGRSGRGRRAGQAVAIEFAKPSKLAQSLSLNGTLKASESVDLRSELSGRVLSVHFSDGQPVKKGDVLVLIDARELQAELRSAQTRLALAKQTADRQTSLYERGLVSKQDYDKAISESAVLRAQHSLLAVRTSKSVIRAPFDGRIGLRQVSPGAMVTPSTPIANIRRLDPLHLDFSAPERYQSYLRVGTTVSLHVDGIDKTFEATVSAIEPQVEEATRTLRLRALVANTDHMLLPGNFARVTLPIAQFDATFMIPSTALVRGLNEAYVFVVDEASKARKKKVTLGLRDAERIQVLSGISDGDKVIVRGVGLVDGAPVRVIDARANAVNAVNAEPNAEHNAKPNTSATLTASPTSTIPATSESATPQRAAEGNKP